MTLAGQQLKLSDRSRHGVQLYFADLDGLKWINDTLGHEEGDRALVEVADLFREASRSSDILARPGGDEFAILAMDSENRSPELLLGRVQAQVEKRNRQENRKYRLSISVGCAVYTPEHPCSIDELLSRADQGMYEEKKSRKGASGQTAAPA